MIPSRPESPKIPPIKILSEFKNSIGLKLTTLRFPEDGGNDILSYQLFMRNGSHGFTMVMEIPSNNSTDNLKVKQKPYNGTFELFYRAVNQLGPGGNSSIVRFLDISVPKIL